MIEVRLHALVRGHVQRVGYRRFVRKSAKGLGLTGWVMNNADGSVEIVAEGGETDLHTFLELLRQGPRRSQVEDVRAEWEPARHTANAFSYRRP